MSARATECSRYPCRITDREGTAIGYLLERFHPSFSVYGSNCLQKFASAIARLGWYRRAQWSSRIGNTIDRFQVAQQSHTCTSIQHSNVNSHAKSESLFQNFGVFDFHRYAVSTKINYSENFRIYSTDPCVVLRMVCTDSPLDK